MPKSFFITFIFNKSISTFAKLYSKLNLFIF